MWRPKAKWQNPFRKTGNFGCGEESWNEQPEFSVYEAGADAAHQADIEWLELNKSSATTAKGYHIFVVSDEDWQAFKGEKNGYN